MNPTRIAVQALRYRMATISDSFTAARVDAEAIAQMAIEQGDSTINTSIRSLTTAWKRAGLDTELMTEPWCGPRIDNMFSEDPTLIDAVDDIIRTAHRAQFSRPRRRPRADRPRHRPVYIGDRPGSAI